jgi:CRP-like cAMP-binding protein
MAEARTDVLARVPLFARLSRRQLRNVLEQTSEYEYDEGDVIVKDGTQGHTLFVLIEGKARVVKGNRTVARLSTGDFFGEIAVLDRYPRTASVVADSPLVCLVLHREDLRKVLSDEPEVAWSMLGALASRLRGD